MAVWRAPLGVRVNNLRGMQSGSCQHGVSTRRPLGPGRDGSCGSRPVGTDSVTPRRSAGLIGPVLPEFERGAGDRTPRGLCWQLTCCPDSDTVRDRVCLWPRGRRVARPVLAHHAVWFFPAAGRHPAALPRCSARVRGMFDTGALPRRVLGGTERLCSPQNGTADAISPNQAAQSGWAAI